MIALPIPSRRQRLKAGIIDYLSNRAGTEQAFLNLINWFRFAILIFLTLRFGVSQEAYTDNVPLFLAIRLALWCYFIFIVSLRFLANFQPRLFESDRSKKIQVLVDITVIAFFYAVGGAPDSDIFLFYFLPLLVIARYFATGAMAAFLGLTGLATAVTWYYLVSPENLTSFSYWIEVLLSRPGFLGVLTLFYLVYQRRRQTVGHLTRAESDLLYQFHSLAVGAYAVDSNLRVISVNEVMVERHGPDLMGKGCSDAFCHATNGTETACRQCPARTAIEQSQATAGVELFMVDRQGTSYLARVSALPVFGEQGAAIGATAIVEDLSRRKVFEGQLRSYAADVERAVETLVQESRARAEEKTRQLEAISRAAAAVLSPDQPLRINQIIRTMAGLLRCQIATVRRYEWDSTRGQSGLTLRHSFGYPIDNTSQWHFLSLKSASLVVDAFQKGEARRTDDVQAVSDLIHFKSKARQYGLHAMACFPLLAQGEKLGTVSMYRNRRERFSPEEMSLGQALANNLAAAIANQNLIERVSTEADSRQKRLKALNALSQRLVPHDNVDSLTELVTDFVRERLAAEVAAVFLLEGNYLYRQAISGVEPGWFGDEHYAVGHGITGKAALAAEGERYGRMVVENRVSESNNVIPEHLTRYRQQLATGTVQHLLAVPLNGQEKSFGVLRVVNKVDSGGQLQPEGFDQWDVELLTTIACIVAVAIENTQRLAEQTFLMQVGQTVTTSLSRQDILTRSLHKAVTFLQAEAGAVILPDPNSGDMVFSHIGGQGAEQLRGRTIPAGKGITGFVFATGAPALVPDVTQDPRFYAQVEAQTNFSTRSLLSVPIQAGDSNIGVLEILNKRQGTFTSTDLRLLSALSAWIAIAVEKARLFEAEQKRRRLAEALRQAMQIFSSTLDANNILDTILSQLGSVVTYNTASLFLLEKNVLRLKAHAGFSGEESDTLTNICLDASQNVPFQTMLATQQPYIVADAQQEQVLERIIGTGRIRSWIGAPLLFGNRVLGQLAVDNWLPGQYTADDAAVVMAFAQQVAIAIANARLYGQQQERANQLLILNNSLVDFTTAQSMGEVLDKVAQCVIELLHCEIAGVALYDKEKGEVYSLPDHGYLGVSPAYARKFRFHIDTPGGDVLRSRRIHTVEDVTADPDSIFGEALTKPIGVRGIMAAPMLISERKVGILYAGSREPRQFGDDEQTLLSILAGQAAVAIRNAELFTEKERRAELLELFNQISIASQRTSDLASILNIVLTGVTAEYGLRFNRAILLLVDAARQNLVGYTGIGQTSRAEAQAIWERLHDESFDQHVHGVLQYGVPEPTSLYYAARNLQIPIKTDSQEVFSHAYVTGKSLIVDPARGEWLIDTNFYRLFEPGTFALVPLSGDGRTIGIMVVDNKFTGGAITPGDLELLGTCASQAAAAIERTELHEAVQNRIRVLHLLQEVGRTISQLSDLRQVLERIAKAANEVLAADISYLTPFDPEKKELLVELGVSAGLADTFTHDRTYSHTGLTTLVMNEPGGLVIIDDISLRPRLSSRFVKQAGIQSVAAVRLEFRGETVGVLYVNYRQRHLFDDQDKQVLKMFAGQAAIAIHNARLMKQMEALATQKERNRLRDDIHDALNTFQFKVMLPLEVVLDRIKAMGDDDVAEELSQLWRFSNYTNQNFHRIMQDMRDPILVEKGLVAAIIALKKNILDASGIETDLGISGKVRPSAEVEHVLYRIAQEAISNVVKHANLASDGQGRVHVVLSLDSTPIRLSIQDNGIGFALDQIQNNSIGVGMGAMKNWAKQIGAEFSIISAPGRGTRIEVTVSPEDSE